MEVRKVGAKIVRDSRNERTIKVFVKTSKGKFSTAGPSGESTGRYEVKPYGKSLVGDINYINNLDVGKLGINKFEDLRRVERLVGKKLGGNSLFALEASLLKALAKEKGKELWSLLGTRKSIRSIGNAIGGGLHSRGVKDQKPEFQEFLFIAKAGSFKECVKINETAYDLAHIYLQSWKRNDEGAWETGLNNEEVLSIMDNVRDNLDAKKIKVDIGIDIAASSFFKKNYKYKNPKRILTNKEQVDYISSLIKNYDIFYIEDPVNENDFLGFSKLLKKVGKKKSGKSKAGHLIVGDDLTTTNPSRLKKAIKNKSINAIIVKPNQIGSLLKVKEVIDLAKKSGIKTIMSHRSGETKDNTIADLAVGWQVDFIKTGIHGRVRRSKLKRIIKIERK